MNRRTARPRLRGLVVALGLVAAATLVGPATAAHAVGSLYRVDATSANNIVSPKSVTATCNAGDRLVGAGGRINNGGGQVVLARVIPNAALTSVTAWGIEHNMRMVGWEVQAFAVCDPNPPANLQLVTQVSPVNAVAKTVVATCAAGQQLYGGGFQLSDGFGQVFPDDVRPDAGLTSMTITAFADPGFGGNWGVTSHAICADPSPTWSRQQFTSVNNPTSPKTETTPLCPGNSQVSGVGGEITGALGEVTITALTPRPQLTMAEATGDENGPFGANWTTTVYAICHGL